MKSGKHSIEATSHDEKRKPRKNKVVAASLGFLLAGIGAFAGTNWVVGLSSGSSSQGQAASVSNLTIAAVSSPSPTNLLYPGGTGDIVLTINNPNPFPVTITAVQLPTNITYGVGYSNPGLSTTISGCSGSTSLVSYAFATGTSGTSHNLSSALTVDASGGANNPLSVTLTNDASMALTAPAACESAYFSMPSFIGVTATGGAGTGTTSPATDAWTS